MSVIDKKSIQSIRLLDDVIVIGWLNTWYQEDIEDLLSVIVSLSNDIEIVEKLIGADRESIRVIWQQQFYFVLHFDFYSQSCWIDGEDHHSSKNLPALLGDIMVDRDE